jgi:hypothetical protein
MTIVAYGFGIVPGSGGGPTTVSECPRSVLDMAQSASIDGSHIAGPPVVKDSFNDGGIVNRNLSRRINQNLYSLKRLWGGSFTIYKLNDASTAHLTGVKDIDATVIHIRRGIVMPGKSIRDVKTNISMISANKSFAFGGTYDTTARMFIVDRKDAPDLELTESDWIVFDNQRYEVKEFQEFEFDSAWVIAGQAIEGETPEQIRLLSADNLLRLDQNVEVI